MSSRPVVEDPRDQSESDVAFAHRRRVVAKGGGCRRGHAGAVLLFRAGFPPLLRTQL